MTAFWIKIIAIISMTFDHGAYHLMEPSLWYEIIRSFGRLIQSHLGRQMK